MLTLDKEYLKHFSFGRCLSYIFLVLIVGTGCNSTKNLKSGEKILRKNVVQIDKEKGQVLPPNLNYNLTTLYKQKPNSDYFFIPREKIYAKNQEHIANGKSPKKWRTKRGEPLAVYDEALTEETRQNIVYYLNNRGFFNAEVGFEILPKRKEGVLVKYLVRPNKGFQVDTLIYESSDPAIHTILQRLQRSSRLRDKSRVSQEEFAKEYSRIISYLNNNGYAKIDKTYFKSYGDSTDNKVNVKIEILPPRNNKAHQVFSIGKINVYPNYYASTDHKELKDTLIQGIHFKTENNTFKIKPETITRNIFISESMLYDQRLVKKTQTQLDNLNSFRIISIQPKVRADDPAVMDFEIFLTPRKQLAFQMDLEVNNSSQNTLSDGKTNLIGTSLRTNYKNYNAFHNATIFDLAFGGGVEFDIGNLDSLIYSADFSGNVGLSFPRYIKWLGPYGVLNKINLGKDEQGVKKPILSHRLYNLIREKAKTNLNIGYEFVNIIEFYDYHSLEVNFGYSIPLNKKANLNIQQSGFTLFQPDTMGSFSVLAQANEFLEKSFSSQLFTGLLFRNASYNYNNPVNKYGETWGFLGELDLSGFEVYLANKVYNAVSGTEDTIRLNQIDFSQFIKLQVFANYTRKFDLEKAVAIRLNLGIARPFGFSRGQGVPYLQQLTAGGPNSLRGWRIRELGPGGYIDSLANNDNRVFFQAGDLKFEANIEWRFPLFWYFKGAFFLDLGNIWTIREDPDRPNSQFRFSSGTDNDGNKLTPFYDQIAIASGFGLRMDVSYFIVRLDIGLKVRNPYAVDNSYWFPKISPFKFNTPNYNLAIAYPF